MLSGSFRVLNMAIMFFTSVLSTRYLGVELKGQYSYLSTLVAFSWMALDLGLNKTYSFLLRKNGKSLNTLFTWSYILFAVELVIIGSLGAIFLSKLNILLSFDFSYYGWAIFVALILVSQLMNQIQMIFLGLDKVMAKSMLSLSYHVVTIILIGVAFLFFQDSNRLYAVLLSMLIGAVAAIILSSWKYFQRFNLKSLNLPFLWNSYKMGIRVFLSSLFITMLLRVDIFILKHLTDYYNVGIYSLSAHIIDMLQIGSNLVGSLLLVKLADTDDIEIKWVLLKRIFMLFFVFLGLANLGFVLVGKPIIMGLYGSAFKDSYYATLWLIPASFGLSFGSLFNTYLWSKGFPLVSTIIPFFVLISNIILNYILIPLMGISGAALASSISYCLWFIVILLFEQNLSQGRMLKYLVPHRQDWGEVWEIGLASLRSVFTRKLP
jgi:O-antigen/teichoic acid export membrane protein